MNSSLQVIPKQSYNGAEVAIELHNQSLKLQRVQQGVEDGKNLIKYQEMLYYADKLYELLKERLPEDVITELNKPLSSGSRDLIKDIEHPRSYRLFKFLDNLLINFSEKKTEILRNDGTFIQMGYNQGLSHLVTLDNTGGLTRETREKIWLAFVELLAEKSWSFPEFSNIRITEITPEKIIIEP